MKPSFPAIIYRRYKTICSYSKDLPKAFGEEDIHNFRLEVKKLRAIYRLLNAKGNKKHHLPERLMSFYHMAGVIRNLQLQRRALLEYAASTDQPAPISCTAILDGRIAVAVRQSQLALEMHPFRVRTRRRTGAGLTKYTLAEKTAALAKRESSLLQALPAAGPWPDTAIHELRKSVKDLLYVWPYLDNDAIKEIRPESLGSKEALHELSLLIGDYLDIEIRMQLLRDPAYLFAAGQEAKPFLQAASENWQSRKAGLLEKIRQTLHPATAAIPPLKSPSPVL